MPVNPAKQQHYQDAFRHVADTLTVVFLGLIVSYSVRTSTREDHSICIHFATSVLYWLLLVNYVIDWFSAHVGPIKPRQLSLPAFLAFLVFVLIEAYACIAALDQGADVAAILLLLTIALGLVWDFQLWLREQNSEARLWYAVWTLMRGMLLSLLCVAMVVSRFLLQEPELADFKGVHAIVGAYIVIKAVRLVQRASSQRTTREAIQ